MKRNIKESQVSQEEILDVSMFRDLALKEIESVVRLASLDMIKRIMEEEVTHLCGESFSHKNGNKFHRGGSEKGSVYLSGQRIRISRPRVRSSEGEVKLKTYSKLRQIGNVSERVLQLLSSGVSTRKYEEVIEKLAKDSGLSKSSVSREFIKESRKSLEYFKNRDFKDKEFFALLVDGTRIGDQVVVVAMGVDISGSKNFIGFSEGSKENFEVVKSLLDTFDEKNILFTKNIICVLDGSKALEKAIKNKFGDRVFIQRCKIHKKRNILAKLKESYHADFNIKYNRIFECNNYKDAYDELQSLIHWLEEINYSASESLKEAGEKLLTLHKINMPPEIRKSFSTTNPIESGFTGPKGNLKRVKRWRLNSDMLNRWVSICLLYQEENFNKIRGVNKLNSFLYSFLNSKFNVDKNEIT